MRILLDNALRHTPDGHAGHRRRRAQQRHRRPDRGRHRPGPARAAARRKVFERFYTGDAARGAGLGLAIARELAERMDGRLRVRSAARGTAFTLELPTNGNGA